MATEVSVLVYAAGATSTDSPVQIIEGSKTKLSYAEDIAVDAKANMYVANYGTSDGKGWVTVYAAGATGNVPPIRTIIGARTGLDRPFGIALDPRNGDIYVANGFGGPSQMGTVTIYAPNANGNVAPIGTIAGTNTGLAEPVGLVLDAGGNIYVPNPGVNSRILSRVTIYTAGSVGNVKPARTIEGSHTELSLPDYVALDSSSNIYVDGGSKNRVTVYAAGANGNVAPIRTIAGSKTRLDGPSGLALDGSGKVYVANANGYVTVYAAGASGNVKPVNEIYQRLGLPRGISIH